MVKEQDKLLNILEKISPLQKEILLLAPVFFWGKYMRRKINSEDFKPRVGKIDFNDPISVLKAKLDFYAQANSDIEGDVVGTISNFLIKHPKRNTLFPHLSNDRIESICFDLEDYFENQELCAEAEGWSYYDEVTPEEFAIHTADAILYFFGIPLYKEISSPEDREIILEAVLKEKSLDNINNLLLPNINT